MSDLSPQDLDALIETLRAVDLHETKQAAADSLGIARSTLAGRLAKARRFGVTKDTTAKTPPSESENKALREQIELLTEQLEKTRAPKVPIPVTKSQRNKGHIRLVFPDIHGNHMDKSAVSAMLADAELIKPHSAIGLGDLLECGGWLAEHHTLGYVAEVNQMCYADDIAAGNDFLDRLQAIVPDVELLEGNHECLTPDHEVMTRRGWVPIADVSLDDSVGSMNPSGEFTWDNPTKLVCNDFNGEVIKASSRSFSAVMTPGHRVPYYSQYKNKLKYRLADSILSDGHSCSVNIPSCASGSYDDIGITDNEIRLVAWILTDGNVSSRVAINQSKPAMVCRIRNMLDQMDISYSENIRNRQPRPICGTEVKSSMQAHVFEILSHSRKYVTNLLGVEDWHYQDRIEKEIPDWVFNLSERQFNIFLDELILGDGSESTGGCPSRCLYGKEEFLSQVQMLCIKNGVRANVSSRSRGGEYAYHALNISPRKSFKLTSENFDRQHYNGKVHCLVMPNENFFTRHNGKAHLTGNCRIEKWCTSKTMGNTTDAEMLRRAIAPEFVMSLEKRGIPYHKFHEKHDGLDCRGVIKRGHCYFTHGFSTAKHAAWQHVQQTAGPVVYGHTHRADYSVTRTIAHGLAAAWCPGCLSQMQPLWQHNKPTTWTHGYLLQFIAEDDTFQTIMVPIDNGKSFLGSVLNIFQQG